MDFPALIRRLSSPGDDSPSSSPSLHRAVSVTPTSRGSSGLTVDTGISMSSSMRKLHTFEGRTSSKKELQPQDDSPGPVGSLPSSPSGEDRGSFLRRRRSNSECLLLARNGEDLPNPCKEYISSVKQILARSEETRLSRRRSMTLRNASLPN